MRIIKSLLSVAILLLLFVGCAKEVNTQVNDTKSETSEINNFAANSPAQSPKSDSNVQGNNESSSGKRELKLEKVWQYDGIENPRILKVIDNCALVAGENTLYSIDAETGTKNWALDLPFNYGEGIYADKDIIAASSVKGFLEIIDRKNGNLLLDLKAQSPIYSVPVKKDNSIYVVTSEGQLVILDLISGQQAWNFTPPKLSFNQYNSPIEVNNTLYYVSGTNGDLYAIDLQSKSEKWHIENLEISESQLISIGNIVMVVSENGKVYAIDTEKEKILWNIDIKTGINISNILSDSKRIYLSNYNNDILGVDIKRGNIGYVYNVKSGKLGYMDKIGDNIFFTIENDIVSLNLATNEENKYGLNIPTSGRLVIKNEEIYLTI